jgi:hypothetical protein
MGHRVKNPQIGKKEEGTNRPFTRMATNRPSLPTNQAFVVQLHDDVEVEKGQFFGRVEHVVSGKATRFASLEELVAFIKQVLREQSASDEGDSAV